jgi:hypothetical protein
VSGQKKDRLIPTSGFEVIFQSTSFFISDPSPQLLRGQAMQATQLNQVVTQLLNTFTKNSSFPPFIPVGKGNVQIDQPDTAMLPIQEINQNR